MGQQERVLIGTSEGLGRRGATVVVGTGDGRVYASPDGGASFAVLTKGLPTGPVRGPRLIR